MILRTAGSGAGEGIVVAIVDVRLCFCGDQTPVGHRILNRLERLGNGWAGQPLPPNNQVRRGATLEERWEVRHVGRFAIMLNGRGFAGDFLVVRQMTYTI
jgi:hypothetical protein